MKCHVWFLPFCVLTLAAGSAKYAKEGDTLRDRYNIHRPKWHIMA